SSPSPTAGLSTVQLPIAAGRQRGRRVSVRSKQSATLNVHVPAARSASQPESPSRQRWRAGAFPSAPGRPAAFITRHTARHSGPGGPPPGTKKVGSQLRVERRQAEVQPSVPPVKPSVAQVRPPRSAPSHSSRPLITPLPQNEQRLASK